ncbi:hypothetical protein IFO69_01745 [Echinicola sp. CAU 1574]|uniref:Uncharacterized protein n=1 Tax=Echinicola arenosa TaxID=2774144 RepID=A0ABR9AIL3_9BACT|nr:hypothetical protein [Echinicola arenosa]MBD8487459.1 hypothetical protein [Echinicola arenosa]
MKKILLASVIFILSYETGIAERESFAAVDDYCYNYYPGCTAIVIKCRPNYLLNNCQVEDQVSCEEGCMDPW